MVKIKEAIRTQTRPTTTRKGFMVGYKRVSALDQTDLRQLDGVELDKLFTDKASGQGLRMKDSSQDLAHVVVVPACAFASSL